MNTRRKPHLGKLESALDRRVPRERELVRLTGIAYDGMANNAQVRFVVSVRFHSFHAWSMPPVATACLVPVVTMVASVIGTPASL